MNQIVSFMEKMIPLIMKKEKILTTRLKTEYRLKLNVNDIIYIYSNIRTERAEKCGNAIIINSWIWNQNELLNKKRCPINIFSYYQFAKFEGFNNVLELKNFFKQKQYQNKDLITYQFVLFTD